MGLRECRLCMPCHICELLIRLEYRNGNARHSSPTPKYLDETIVSYSIYVLSICSTDRSAGRFYAGPIRKWASPLMARAAPDAQYLSTHIYIHAHVLYELPPRRSKQTGQVISHWLQIISQGYTAPYSCSTCHHAEGKEGVGFPLVGGLIIFFYYKPIRCIYEAGGCGFTLDMIMEIGRVMMVPR